MSVQKSKRQLKTGGIVVYTYWRAYIAKQGKQIFLGYHTTEEKAAKTYDSYARRWHGERAILNFKEPHA